MNEVYSTASALAVSLEMHGKFRIAASHQKIFEEHLKPAQQYEAALRRARALRREGDFKPAKEVLMKHIDVLGKCEQQRTYRAFCVELGLIELLENVELETPNKRIVDLTKIARRICDRLRWEVARNESYADQLLLLQLCHYPRKKLTPRYSKLIEEAPLAGRRQWN
jgi:hypothetical protein